MLVFLTIEAHPRPFPKQFFLAKADGLSGPERNWTKEAIMEVRSIGLYEVQFAVNPQESGSFKIVYECDGTVEGEPAFRNFSDTFEVNVFCEYKKELWVIPL